LNEGLGFCVHREKSIANPQTKSTASCNYFEKSFGCCDPAAGLCKLLIINDLQLNGGIVLETVDV
jgi:hypothetical protein